MKYDKMEINEYADFFKQSKHIKVQEDFLSAIELALKNSTYSKGELANRLDWSLGRLNNILSGDFNINFYEAVHLAGALGYKLEISIKDVGDE